MQFKTIAASLLAISSMTAPGADNAQFDLAGPKITMCVARGGPGLPVVEVPSLLPGDKLWIKADLTARSWRQRSTPLTAVATASNPEPAPPPR